MKRTSSNILLKAVTASLIAACLITGIHYLIRPAFTDDILGSFIATLLGLAVVLLAIRLRVLNPFELIGRKYLAENTGFERRYQNFHAAFDDLRLSFRNSRRVYLLLHIGRREFGDRSPLFADLLKKKISDDAGTDVKILHIDEDSPYLSEERAQELGKNHDKWVRDVRYVREHIEEALTGAKDACLRSHREPYIWRLFIFDSEIYVSGYIRDTKNDLEAPVFRIKRGSNSLFDVFEKYYQHLWMIYKKSMSYPAGAETEERMPHPIPDPLTK